MNHDLPLTSYKVVELATVVAAPTAGRIMADFGAQVIKIEMPPDGDLLRRNSSAHQMPEEPENNPLFDMFNSGKKLIALNLKNEKCRELLFMLLGSADVLISNMRMNSLERLGLSYAQLKERFPRLIYAHFSGMGPNGPDAGRPGFDTTAFWMRSGAAVDSVPSGNFLMRPSFGMGDIASASCFLNGILMALLARAENGKGTLVETSLYGAGIWHNSSYIVNSQPQYGRRFPADRYDPWDPFSEWYLCRDGRWLAIVRKVYSKDRYIFSEIFNMPELISDPDYETIQSLRNSGKLPQCTRRIEEVMKTKTLAEWKQIFDRFDIPCEAGVHFKDVYQDPQAWANGYLENVNYPDGVVTAMPVPPIAFSEYGRRSFTRQSYIGHDTREILEAYGVSGAESEALFKSGAVI